VSLKMIVLAAVFLLLMRCATSEAKCRHPRDCNPSTISAVDICDFHKVDK
jgi:hypothetical protein